MTGYNQEPKEDTLLDRGLDDNLDEGYSPPDRQPASHRRGTTAEEQREGETLDERLEQEVADPDPGSEASGGDPDSPWAGEVLERPRAGRLVEPDEGVHEDEEKDLLADDVGIDGGASSAEEAAVHVIDEDEL